ncbi:hypothetical protein HAX54_014300 [Datura stramonium]|uniref:Uncharacterized protein n=1 Tax=Datura stramonium TaxID=4076 RepID=A0ABS8Y685_DATST|nr:hypothetical protein [Datura stramonium]
MAEMSVPVASLQSFPKSPLCSLSTRKFNSSYGLWVSSATASPSPRFCLISTYNSFRFCAAVVNAASSPQRNRKESMVPPYNVLITGGSKVRCLTGISILRVLLSRHLMLNLIILSASSLFASYPYEKTPRNLKMYGQSLEGSMPLPKVKED